MPDFIAPTITNIEYTGAQTVAPHSDDWPVSVTSLELGLRLSGGSWTAHASGIESEDVVVLVDLEPNTEYGVRWEGGAYDGDETLFTTLEGVPGSEGALLTPEEDTTPEIPGPVTFDNLHATSVECAHLDPLPERTEDFYLRYREYTAGGIHAWITAVTNPTEDIYYIVEGLDSETDYEFKFVAENSHGITDGPIARIITNASTDPSELTPDAPGLTPYACPEGKTQVSITLPAFVGTTDSMVLQRATSLLGPWTTYGSAHDNLDTFDVVGLTAATTYYFRVVQYSGAVEYVGSPVAHLTLPELPAVPDVPTLGEYNDADNYLIVTMPALPARAEWLDLERGEGSTEEDIEWLEHWERLTTGEDFPDVGLEDDKHYWYRVVAVNACGLTYGEPIDTDTYATLPEAPPPVYLKELQGSFVITRRTFDFTDRATSVKLRQLNGATLDTIGVEKDVDLTLADLTVSTEYTLSYWACNHLGCTEGERVIVLTKLSDVYAPPEKPSQPELGEITYSSIVVEGFGSLGEGVLSLNLLYREVNASEFISIPYTTLPEIITLVELMDNTLYEIKWEAVGETYNSTSNSCVVATLIAPPEKPEKPEVE